MKADIGYVGSRNEGLRHVAFVLFFLVLTRREVLYGVNSCDFFASCVVHLFVSSNRNVAGFAHDLLLPDDALDG